MEEILLRFPKLGQNIFNHIDDQSLVASRKVNKVWNTFLDNNRFFWIRVIKSYRRNQVGYEKEWKAILEKIPLETSREMAVATQKFYKLNNRLERQHSPLHIVADNGICLLFKFVYERIKEVNPKQSNGVSAFHFAAQGGHLQICEYMISKLDDKNPRTSGGHSALEFAANKGHFEVCKLIVDNVKKKESCC